MSSDGDRASVWKDARNVLCVRLDGLGDLLMTAPAIRALRAVRRDRRITLLASQAGVDASALLPEIDAAIRFDAPWMKATTSPSSEATLAMRERLAAERFDAAVIFTVYSQNPLPGALLCHLAGIPLRLAHCRENPYALLTDWVPETEPFTQVRHEVRRQLDLVALVGANSADSAMRIAIPASGRDEMARVLEELGAANATRIVVMHPGASAPSRRYPVERLAMVARQLSEQTGARVIVTGGNEERHLAASICASGHAQDASGKLTLPALCALIERAALLVSNNTAPAHIASSVGTPVVDLYALTNPQHTPWRVPSRVLFHDVPCRYCYKSICPQGHHECLRGVSVEQVVDASLDLLAGRERRPSPLPRIDRPARRTIA